MKGAIIILASIVLCYSCIEKERIINVNSNSTQNESNKDTLVVSNNGKSYELIFKYKGRKIQEPISNDTFDVIIEPTAVDRKLFEKSTFDLVEIRNEFCKIYKLEKFHYKVLIDKETNGIAVGFSIKLRAKNHIIKQFYRDHYYDTITKVELYEYPDEPGLVVYSFLVKDKPKFLE